MQIFFLFRFFNYFCRLNLRIDKQTLHRMANHPSAIKRSRQIEKRNLLNKYNAKTTRNAVKQLRSTTDKAAAQELLPKVISMLDKTAKKNTIHKNKAANLKSKLTKLVSKL
jgi:small subunit ribosomal protein S20